MRISKPAAKAKPTAPATAPQIRPTGYGRACTNCFRAKCRCTFISDDSPCERCKRLGKECQAERSTRRANTKNLTAATLAQLDEKLDRLILMFEVTKQQTQAQQERRDAAQYLQCPSGSPASDVRGDLGSTPNATIFGRDTLGQVQAETAETHPQTPPTISNSPQGLLPTEKEADILLNKFKAWLPSFPFMHLSVSTTAAVLRQAKPFLWLCIMTLTSMSNTQHRHMRELVRCEISERIITKHERSMDLLLGLIAYLSWSFLNVRPEFEPFMVLYTHLATLMVNELGLLRPESEEYLTTMRWKTWDPSQYAPREPATEDRTAVLVVWFLSSIGNSFTGRVDTILWSPYLDECLEVVDKSHDEPGACVLTYIIQMQRLLDEAHQHLRNVTTTSRKSGQRAPSHLHKPSLLARLQTLHVEISVRFPTNSLLMLQLKATEVHVAAIGLFGADLSDAESVESMWLCVTHIKSFYQMFFAIPIKDIPGLPFYIHVTDASVKLILYRLTISNGRIWNGEDIRSSVDVIDILGRSIELFHSVAKSYTMADEDANGNLFQSGARWLYNLRSAWASELNRQRPAYAGQDSQNLTQNNTDAAAVADALMFPGQTQGGFNKMSWIAEIFGLWQM